MKRSRMATTAVVTVVAAGAVVGLWWKPWQSPVALPKSACWGALAPNDLRPVVGTTGKVEGVSRGHMVPSWLTPSDSLADEPLTICYIDWNGKPVTTASITAYNDSNLQAFEGQTTAKPETLAPGILLLPYTGEVKVIFRCDRLKPKFTYAVADASSLDGGIEQSGPSEAERNGYAGIALKLAKAAAPQMQCNNPLDFPASVPTLKPMPPY